MSKLTLQNIVSEWVEVGQTYNEENGIDDVRGKLIDGQWAYVQIEWSHRIPSLGFILYNGKSLEELTDLQPSDPEAK